MRRTEELDKADAIEALKVAEFPLLLDDGSSETTVITNRAHYGREGLLPVKLFAPTPYYVGHPKYATIIGNPSRAAYDITKQWNGNLHVNAVLESHMGYRAHRVGTHILQEMVYLSSSGHHANIAFSAGRILVDPETKQETMLALWDDGDPYASAEEIQQRFSEDVYHELQGHSLRRKPLPAAEEEVPYPACPTTLVIEAAGVFNGSLSVLSGDMRTDITKGEDSFAFAHTTTAGIVGNLVVARLPHTAGTLQPA